MGKHNEVDIFKNLSVLGSKGSRCFSTTTIHTFLNLVLLTEEIILSTPTYYLEDKLLGREGGICKKENLCILFLNN